MPIIVRSPIRRLSQAEFGKLAYSVMSCVFEIHNEFGRFFDERIYKRELAHQHPGVQLEVPIEIIHATFKKIQYIDVLVACGGPFEFKVVDAVTPRHPAQLLHYMLMAGLAHGKLVNLGKEGVGHEFVNTTLTHEDRIRFCTKEAEWTDRINGADRFRQVLIALLRDWGTGLDVELYEEAMTHLLGGETRVFANVEVRTLEHTVGHQKVRLIAPRVAFSLTTLPVADTVYESHTRRLLRHMELDAALWANIALKTVTFTAVT